MVDVSRLPLSVQYELAEDEGANPSGNPTMGDIIAERLARRDFLKGSLAASALAAVIAPLALGTSDAQRSGIRRHRSTSRKCRPASTTSTTSPTATMPTC